MPNLTRGLTVLIKILIGLKTKLRRPLRKLRIPRGLRGPRKRAKRSKRRGLKIKTGLLKKRERVSRLKEMITDLNLISY